MRSYPLDKNHNFIVVSNKKMLDNNKKNQRPKSAMKQLDDNSAVAKHNKPSGEDRNMTSTKRQRVENRSRSPTSTIVESSSSSSTTSDQELVKEPSSKRVCFDVEDRYEKALSRLVENALRRESSAGSSTSSTTKTEDSLYTPYNYIMITPEEIRDLNEIIDSYGKNWYRRLFS